MGNHTAAQARATSARRGGAKGASGGGSGKATPKPRPSPPKPKVKPGPSPDATKAARDAADRAAWRAVIAEQRNPANYAPPTNPTLRAALVGAASDDQRVSLREAARALTASRRWVGERALAIGADGRVLTATARGVVKGYGHEEVDIPAKEWAAIRADSAPAYLHTHPFGSFSRGDVMVFAERALASMHATGPGPDGKTWMFSLFQGRNPGSTNGRLTASVARRTGLSRAYSTTARQVDREMTDAIRAGRMTPFEADGQYAHTVMQRLAAQIGPDYLVYEAGPLE